MFLSFVGPGSDFNVTSPILERRAFCMSSISCQGLLDLYEIKGSFLKKTHVSMVSALMMLTKSFDPVRFSFCVMWPVLCLNWLMFWVNMNSAFCVSAGWTLLWTRSFWRSQVNFRQNTAEKQPVRQLQPPECKSKGSIAAKTTANSRSCPTADKL